MFIWVSIGMLSMLHVYLLWIGIWQIIWVGNIISFYTIPYTEMIRSLNKLTKSGSVPSHQKFQHNGTRVPAFVGCLLILPVNFQCMADGYSHSHASHESLQGKGHKLVTMSSEKLCFQHRNPKGWLNFAYHPCISNILLSTYIYGWNVW